jgi:hypothetical protein
LNEFELEWSRVGFKIDEAPICYMLLTGIRGTTQIDHSIGVPQQSRAMRLVHPYILFTGRIEKSPFAAKAKAVQDLTYQFEVRSSIGHQGARYRVVDVSPVIFDIVDITAQLPEADEMVQKLPDDATKWVSYGEMKKDDFAFTLAPQGCHLVKSVNSSTG